jgi:hypothetical protein
VSAGSEKEKGVSVGSEKKKGCPLALKKKKKKKKKKGEGPSGSKLVLGCYGGGVGLAV